MINILHTTRNAISFAFHFQMYFLLLGFLFPRSTGDDKKATLHFLCYAIRSLISKYEFPLLVNAMFGLTRKRNRDGFFKCTLWVPFSSSQTRKLQPKFTAVGLYALLATTAGSCVMCRVCY